MGACGSFCRRRLPRHCLTQRKSRPGPSDFAYELVGARLVNVDSHLQPVAALAESREAANGQVNDWIFRLRRGAEFHNGRSVTAQDVIYSVNRLRDPAAQSPLRVLLDHVERYPC
ncbi:ABC transporter substrate-binding protein [Bradyrhizobium sp. BR 1432]|uniref:ABC transporter substrate-binding protein n=1 Tax=Bradyrhizobium sp. BR 1432 TaxID=3447966 RepID=UPI003EE426D0